MVEVRYGDMPDEVRMALEPLIEKWAWLLPGWCHLLNVEYRGTVENDPTAYAGNRTSVEYRNATIQVAGKWLERCDRDREEDVVHELLHTPLSAMRIVMLDSLASTENLPFRSFVEEQWRVAMESAVCDLAYALMNHA